jgi:hypothetical protein
MTGSAYRIVRDGACAALCALAALELIGAGLPGAEQALLYLLPAALLLGALSLRRYPGERLLLRIIGVERRAPRRRAQRVAPGEGRDVRIGVPRGPSLIAFSLAVRPPPAPGAVFS